CNQIVDDVCDDDKDGYAITANGTLPGGDCNDSDPLINPGAFEYVGNMIDDNCNDKIDEPPTPCSDNGMADPLAFASSMDVCTPWIMDAKINADSDTTSHAIRQGFGKYVPRQGASFVVLSTGVAADKDDMGFVVPQPGTVFHNDDPNPFPQDSKNAC